MRGRKRWKKEKSSTYHKHPGSPPLPLFSGLSFYFFLFSETFHCSSLLFFRNLSLSFYFLLVFFIFISIFFLASSSSVTSSPFPSVSFFFISFFFFLYNSLFSPFSPPLSLKSFPHLSIFPIAHLPNSLPHLPFLYPSLLLVSSAVLCFSEYGETNSCLQSLIHQRIQIYSKESHLLSYFSYTLLRYFHQLF